MGEIRLEVVVDLFEAERLADVIIGAARTGSKAGDGKLWITDVERVVRILGSRPERGSPSDHSCQTP